MIRIWTRSPAAGLLLAVLAAGLTVGCAEKPAPSPPSPPLPRTGDYEVYSAVLREHLINPMPEEHGDGLEPACPAEQRLDPVMMVRETRFRRDGSGSRDSSLAAELSADQVVLFTALRSLDRLPPRPLDADSFALGVPVVLTDSLDRRHSPEGWGAITVSRVVYNADSTRAMVHAVKPCLAELDPSMAELDEGDRGIHGRALLAALDRRQGGWTVVNAVLLYAE
jgi:hypothetical protein